MKDLSMMTHDLITAYRVLGVHRDSTDAEIKAAHRALCMKYHPDRDTGNHDRFLEIQRAYNALKGVPPANRISMMNFIGIKCERCLGIGVFRKTRNYKVISSTACETCGGSGYLLPERRKP